MTTLTQLAHASLEVWADHDLDGYLEFFAPDAVYHGPRRTVRGTDELRSFFEVMMEAYPDETTTIDLAAETGNTVLFRYVDVGTHSGTLRWSPGRHVPPTGRSFEIRGMSTMEFDENQKIVDYRDFLDLYDLLFVQLQMPFPARGLQV